LQTGTEAPPIGAVFLAAAALIADHWDLIQEIAEALLAHGRIVGDGLG
jgi:hypothetical protein